MKKLSVNRFYLLTTILVVCLACAVAIAATVRSGENATAGQRWSGPYQDRTLQVLVTPQNLLVLKDPDGFSTLYIGLLSTQDGAIQWSSQSEGAPFAYCLLEGKDMRLMDAEKQTQALLSLDPPAEEDQALAKEVLGTWAMQGGVPYMEMTFTQDGVLRIAMPSEDMFNVDASYVVDGGMLYLIFNGNSAYASCAVDGDYITIDTEQESQKLVRASGPLSRGVTQQESVSTDLDAEIVGTWGGARQDQYVEWTFHGDGTYQYLVPANADQSSQGSFTTKDGLITLRSGDETLQATYEIQSTVLGLAFGDDDSYGYNRMAGPLTREGATQP